MNDNFNQSIDYFRQSTVWFPTCNPLTQFFLTQTKTIHHVTVTNAITCSQPSQCYQPITAGLGALPHFSPSKNSACPSASNRAGTPTAPHAATKTIGKTAG